MGHTRLVSVAAFAAVLGLVGAACSSGDDSSPETATTASAATVGSVATAETVASPDTTDATTTSAPAVPGTGQAEPVPSVAPSATSASAEPAPSASSSDSAPQGISKTPDSTTTTTATASASTTTTSTTTTSTTTTTTSTTTTTTIPSADDLRVQVLNGSGISGAAGRLTARLEEAGWDVLPAGNAPRRYAVSAVYYSHDVLEDQAAEIAVDTGVSGVAALPMPSPAPFVVEGADVYVVVLIGADDLGGSLRPPARTSSLRPRPRNDVALPLPDSTPRDRLVPGLSDIQVYTPQNDENPETFNYIHSLQKWLRYVANFRENDRIDDLPEDRGTYENLLAVYASIEEALDWLGFTPQNVCGAPPGYTFTDLLRPTREFSEETQSHRGDAIFTTDRLVELHGGQRINPEENLEFYIRQAVQTAHDNLRIRELMDETEAPQLILCDAWISPAGSIPDFANALWYALLTPGVQPRESLLSQGAYHVKEISRNGNFAYVLICHPTLGSIYADLAWREAGYRAEVVGTLRTNGCQANFERRGHIADYEDEDTIRFAFGERVFSAPDLQSFPRTSN